MPSPSTLTLRSFGVIAITFAIAGCGHATKNIVDRAPLQPIAAQAAPSVSAPPAEPVSLLESLPSEDVSPSTSAMPEVASIGPLPPLPRPVPAPVATKVVVPTWTPPKPCPGGEGWNGLACVSIYCQSGFHFVVGKGCVERSAERRLHSDVGPPFDSSAAKEAVRGVAYRHCLPRGARSSDVVVWFSPAGDVDDVDLRGSSSPEAEMCLRQAFGSARIPAFRGGRHPFDVR